MDGRAGEDEPTESRLLNKYSSLPLEGPCLVGLAGLGTPLHNDLIERLTFYGDLWPLLTMSHEIGGLLHRNCEAVNSCSLADAGPAV